MVPTRSLRVILLSKRLVALHTDKQVVGGLALQPRRWVVGSFERSVVVLCAGADGAVVAEGEEDGARRAISLYSGRLILYD
jgi:hypothetical protein